MSPRIKPDDSNPHAIKRKLVRGTGVNILGMIGKALYPLLWVIITRLYGPTTIGTFMLAYTIIEVCSFLIIWGYQDGILMFASRHVHREHEHPLMYRVMANAVVIVSGLCLALIVFSRFGGPALIRATFCADDASSHQALVPAIQLMVWGLPFWGLALLSVAATRSLMIMKYDALLLGFVRPALLLALAVGFYLSGWRIMGLGLSYLLANMILALLAVFVYLRHFSARGLWNGLRHFSFYWPLTAFSIPQNLNMTFNFFLSGISILLLGAFHVSPARIAFFGTAAEVVRNAKQVRVAFSAVLAPVIARYHAEGKRTQLEDTFSTVSRWTTTAAIPVILFILAFRREILLVFHASYTFNSDFMLVLALAPFLNCAIGLAGALVVMTGHSKWNLANSFFLAAISAALNWWLIPRWDLMGAALATALSASAMSAILLVEVSVLLRIRLQVRRVYKPYVAGVVACLVYAAFSAYALRFGNSSWLHAATAALVLGSYAAALALQGMDQEDRKILLSFLRRKPKPPS